MCLILQDRHWAVYIPFVHMVKLLQSRAQRVCRIASSEMSLGVLTSFGSSNIILALPSDLTETIIPASDPTVHQVRNTAQHTPEKSKCYCY